MSPDEIRTIRGSLSRAAFARLLGVASLTVLRWELPDGNKEARRPRAKMIDAIRKLAADGVGAGAGPRASGDDDEPDPEAEAVGPVGVGSEPPMPPTPPGYDADQGLVQPLLGRLGTESWSSAENQLLILLSAGTLQTNEGRLLATLGIVQAQLFGRFDLRGALATLLPILESAERRRLPRALAGRAHVLAALLFSSPDARFFDLGRVNAYVARAQRLLDPDGPGVDDLSVYLATAAIQGTRFLGPHVLTRTYEAHLGALERASSPLARVLAEACHQLAALAREDRLAAARRGPAYLALVGRLRMPYLYVAILVSLAHQAVHGTAKPDEILSLVNDAKAHAQAAAIAPTEEILRLHGCEIEAHMRGGRFGEAEAAYRSALAAARRDGIPIYPLVAASCRLFVLRNRRDDVAELASALEGEGPPRAGPNHHAFYARAAALSLAGEFEGAIEQFERVCSAPDAAPGIDDLRHDAYLGLVLVRVSLGESEGTRAALCRFEALLQERPSVWHSVALRRLEGVALLLERRLPEARQKLESALAAFRLLGDVAHHALTKLNLAEMALASGAPDGDERMAAAAETLEALGIPQTFSVRMAQVPDHPGLWPEQTMCERLVVAVDRLSVCRLRVDQFRQEVTSIVGALLPGHALSVTPRPSADPTTGDGVHVADCEGGVLRVSVRGDLSAEEGAALRLFQMLCSADGAVPVARYVDAPSDATLPGFIAVAPATRRLKREIAQLSRSSATILVTGESGSGKEVVARGVHDLSLRADKPYVAFNCASVPRDLFEAHLFGYKRGAFTGATSDHPGVIRAADGGTLFLDEIAELPLDTQPKLLRFLENGEIFPVGEQRPRHVNVRILAATHRDLGRSVSEGKFREDLYYRLNVVPLAVPPLRERLEDLVPLARMFIERLTPEDEDRPELGADAVAALEEYTWPGNVRELRNVIERAMAYAPVPRVLCAEHLRIGRPR
jgi:tetratricopeptide (TPR) repeat protein